MALALLLAAVAAVMGSLGSAQESTAATAVPMVGNSLQYPTYFNWTLPDTSALFDYWSFQGGDGAWNASFTQSSWANYIPGQAGQGVSSHSANSSSSPSILFNLPMTAFYVYGRATGLDTSSDLFPLSLIVDSRTPTNVTPTDGLICAVEDLLWGFHKVQLTLYSGQWEFTGIRVVTGASISGPTLGNVTLQDEPFVMPNGSMNDFYDYSEGWEAHDTIGGAGGQKPTNYSHILGNGGAWTNLTIPSGTAWVVLYGAVRPDSKDFTLNWNPLPPLSDSDMLFASNNPWQSASTFYIAPLLPEVNYTLQIINNADNSSSKLALHSMEFYHKTLKDPPDFGSSSKRTNAGAIAGGVIGGVVGLLLIGLLAWWFLRRRKGKAVAVGSKTSNSTDESHSERFEMDDIPEPVPFVTPPPQAVEDKTLSGTTSTGGSSRQQLTVSTSGPSLPAGSLPLSAHPDSATTPAYPTYAESQTLPGSSPVRPTGARLVASNPDPSASTASTSEPIHPMAAELKHGTLRRPRPPPRTRQVEQETDGGALDPEIELVPPVYNPEWARGRGVTGEPLAPLSTLGAGQGDPALSPTTPASYSSLHPASEQPSPVATLSPVPLAHSGETNPSEIGDIAHPLQTNSQNEH